ncbi:MarR family transcriptional regulator [Rhodobacteraceae bacterium WD3A24]|nr:MarR family transcriptional regulator [Rhodobacteraceae bacterium WD3A24]
MQKGISQLARLRELLFEMEQDLGLADLPQNERDVFYAMTALVEDGHEELRTESVKQHPLVAEMPPATFHRALKTLLEREFILRTPRRKVGAFVLNNDSV